MFPLLSKPEWAKVSSVLQRKYGSSSSKAELQSGNIENIEDSGKGDFSNSQRAR